MRVCVVKYKLKTNICEVIVCMCVRMMLNKYKLKTNMCEVIVCVRVCSYI